MNIRNIKVFILIAVISTGLRAAEGTTINSFNLLGNNSNSINVNDDWISASHKKNTPVFTLKTNNNIDFGKQVAIAWNLSDSIIINLNLFENRFNSESDSRNTNTPFNYSKSFNTNLSKSLGKPSASIQRPSLDTNRNVSGYNLGISSKFGMGRNTVLNIDFNYGQLADANLIGFNSPEINTSSFALGFRKSRFGASILTDTYLEDHVDMIDNTRLGIELDWYFSDDTTISFGSKQRINNKQSMTPSSLDSLTGDVQYIKFQHNL